MRYIVALVILFTVFSPSFVLQAQNKYSRAADQAFADQLFLTALQKYQKAYSKVKNNKGERERISFRMGECYRMMNNTKKAEVAYKRLVNNPKYSKDNPKVILLYADMLKANGNYDEAIKQYSFYKEKVPSDPLADIGIESTTRAKEWIENPSKYQVRIEKAINTKEDDFAPAFADKNLNSLLYTSDRNAAKGKDLDNWTGLGFSDFFFTRIDRKGEWAKPVVADGGGMINSKANDGVGQFNPKFSSFYFTRCYNDPKRKNGCSIYRSNRTGTSNWSEPELVDLGGDSSTVMGHPTICTDETIFFSADLPGGFGGKDIWMAKKDRKGGKYLKSNLGPEVNTAGDELFPFIRNDSILYYSSNGLPGMGGLDIYVTTRAKSGKIAGYDWDSRIDEKNLASVSAATTSAYQWESNLDEKNLSNLSAATTSAYQWESSLDSKSFNGISGATTSNYTAQETQQKGPWSRPLNMRYPINSPGDDFGIVFNPEEPEQGFFSSNRTGGKGRDDIYSFIIPPVYFTLEGTITDDRTLQPLADAKVTIVGTNGRSLEDKTDEKGHYGFNKMQISAKTTYDILVTKKDYFNEKGRETTVGLEKSKDLVRNFIMRPIPKKPVVLPDILYDLAKWDLKPQYRDSLQGLIETLDANENIVIELASHTDTRDTDERNDVLSQKRAQSVVDYLITRGIDPERLVAKGYGERVPRTLTKDITREGYTFKAGTVITDSLIGQMPNNDVKEAGHQLNRRTEFSIIRTDYIPRTRPGKNIASTKVEIVIKPEENSIPITKTREGYIQGTSYLNGITTQFTYDPKEKEVYISPETALKLLTDGVIDKSSFDGDASKIIGEGSIADKAVFTVGEIRIGKNTVKELKLTVSKKVLTLRFGENTLKRFGKFTINEARSQLIFSE